MSANLIKERMDKEILEKLQMHFRKANDIYLTCMDRDGNRLFSNDVNEQEVQYMQQFFTEKDVQNLLENSRMTQVETIVEEALETPYVKLCAVVNRLEDSIALIWVVAAVIDELVPENVEIPEYAARTSDRRFYSSIAFLETLSRHLLKMREQEMQVRDAFEQLTMSEIEGKEKLCRTEVMMEIFLQMESNDSFVDIARESIRKVCEILDIQGGCIICTRMEQLCADIICEYCTDENWAIGEKLHGKSMHELPFYDGKSYIISSDSMMPGELEQFFIKHHLSAAIFLPIEMAGEFDMYLCFYEFEKSRIWNLEDVKFINDVKRILLGIAGPHYMQKRLEDANDTLKAILEKTDCAIGIVDCERKEVLYMNHMFRQNIAMNMDQAFLETYIFDPKNTEQEFISREVELYIEKKWLNMSQIQFLWIDGRMVHLLTFCDITEQKLYQQRIECQISKDHLTGLYNRMRCEQDLNAYIKEAEERGSEGAYMLIDMDDFQNINDGLGHQHGDMLLKSIAHNLIRISGIEKNCYRMSGDEFAVIVHGDTYKELSRICKDLREIFNRPWFLKDEDYYCTMSMGVVCFPTDGNNVEELNRKVDIALTTAKKKGKNCLEFYNDKVGSTSFHRLDLERCMRRATLNSCNEFEVYYQPMMRMEADRLICCGAEALVRWESTDLGMIFPKDFIPLAEYLGLINPIGEHILTEAFKRCRYWNDCGYPDYKISVNISVIQLLQPDFASKVKMILEKNHVHPKNVILDVTEDLAINDMNRMRTMLTKLKKLGIHIALDDFGTGYSSLNHIRQLPIDMIKIDQCLTKDISEDAFAEAFVKTVFELARTIGIDICAEGIEQKTQLEVLSRMGVQKVQGFYFGNPMTVSEFESVYLK